MATDWTDERFNVVVYGGTPLSLWQFSEWLCEKIHWLKMPRKGTLRSTTTNLTYLSSWSDFGMSTGYEKTAEEARDWVFVHATSGTEVLFVNIDTEKVEWLKVK